MIVMKIYAISVLMGAVFMVPNASRLIHDVGILTENSFPAGLEEFKISDPVPKCGTWRQHMPKTRDPAAYRIYMNARKLWRTKIEWQLTRDELIQVLEGVRKAAEMGDWGARALMARFYLEGLGVLDSNRVLQPAPEKAVAIVRAAAALDQPWGLYDLGVAYQYGYGGVSQSDKIAWAYFLKAAKLGSPEAQVALAEAYGEARQLKDQDAMRLCAYAQGHGPAAASLGGDRRAVKQDFAAAIEYLQNGVKFGDRGSALSLARLFSAGYWPHMGVKTKPMLEAIGIGEDAERTRRYKEIAAALEINPDLKFTRIEALLPLPPAKLPSWNGILSAVEPESNAPPIY
jgi:TPR repeat protein